MKSVCIVLTIVLMISMIAGCASKEQQPRAYQEVEDEQEPVTDEKVNFKCSNAMQQTFYFLGNNVKIEALGKERESWIIDGMHYMKMSINGENYLVEQPVEQFEMTVEAMKSTYKTSKKVEGFDCEVNVVTEDIMELPNFPAMTNEEFAEKMLEGMTP